MSGPSYLYRRGSGIYFVRFYVPRHLKTAVGSGELHRSTGCRDYRLAKIVASELAAHWHRAIESLQNVDVQKLTAGSLKLLGDGYITLAAAASETGASVSDLASRLANAHRPIFVKVTGLRGWTSEDITEDLDHIRDPITGEVEVVIDLKRLGGPAAQRPYSGYLKVRYPDELEVMLEGGAAQVPICQFLFWPSHHKAFVCEYPGHPVHLGSLYVRRADVTQLASQLLAALTSATVGAKGTGQLTGEQPKGRGKFSELCSRYFDNNSHLWAKSDHRRRKQQSVDMFIELMGDLLIEEIDRKVIRAFSEKIKAIPANRRLVTARFKLKSTSYLDLISTAQQHGLPGLSEGEQRKTLDAISQVFTWAVTEREVPFNPAQKLGSEIVRKAGKRKTKAHEQRSKLADEDLEKVFSAVWFQHGVGSTTAQGRYYHYRPHYYWLPVLALYTGGRLNELSQLYLDDILEQDGIACLDFNLRGEGKIEDDEQDLETQGDKSLKNISSERLIPLPQLVVDLGFMQYVQALRDLGYTRLFPELLLDREKGYGKYAGKWFNDSLLGKQLGIPRDGRKTFHSMRHNFATALGAVNAASNEKADLMGHTRRGTMGEVRYEKTNLARLKELIDSVKHKHPPIHAFDVSQGCKALSDALALKSTRVGKLKSSEEAA